MKGRKRHMTIAEATNRYKNAFFIHGIGSSRWLNDEMKNINRKIAKLRRAHLEFAKSKLAELLAMAANTISLDTSEPVAASQFAKNHRNILRSLEILTTSQNPSKLYPELVDKLNRSARDDKDYFKQYYLSKINSACDDEHHHPTVGRQLNLWTSSMDSDKSNGILWEFKNSFAQHKELWEMMKTIEKIRCDCLRDPLEVDDDEESSDVTD